MAAESKLNFCTNCGTKLEENLRFCTSCGTALETSEIKPVKDQPSVSEGKAETTEPAKQPNEQVSPVEEIEPSAQADEQTALDEGVADEVTEEVLADEVVTVAEDELRADDFVSAESEDGLGKAEQDLPQKDEKESKPFVKILIAVIALIIGAVGGVFIYSTFFASDGIRNSTWYSIEETDRGLEIVTLSFGNTRVVVRNSVDSEELTFTFAQGECRSYVVISDEESGQSNTFHVRSGDSGYSLIHDDSEEQLLPGLPPSVYDSEENAQDNVDKADSVDEPDSACGSEEDDSPEDVEVTEIDYREVFLPVLERWESHVAAPSEERDSGEFEFTQDLLSLPWLHDPAEYYELHYTFYSWTESSTPELFISLRNTRWQDDQDDMWVIAGYSLVNGEIKHVFGRQGLQHYFDVDDHTQIGHKLESDGYLVELVLFDPTEPLVRLWIDGNGVANFVEYATSDQRDREMDADSFEWNYLTKFNPDIMP